MLNPDTYIAFSSSELTKASERIALRGAKLCISKYCKWFENPLYSSNKKIRDNNSLQNLK